MKITIVLWFIIFLFNPTDALTSGNTSVEIFYTSNSSVTKKAGSTEVSNGLTLSAPKYTCTNNHSIFVMLNSSEYSIACNQDSSDYTNYGMPITYWPDVRTMAFPANETTTIFTGARVAGQNDMNLSLVTTSDSVQFVASVKSPIVRYTYKLMIKAQFVAI